MKFSIIIPVHNLENYIKNCLNSIFSQSEKDFEVICVLDQCTDKSKEKILETGHLVKLFECDYHHAGLTRNVGLDAAIGDYIWFVDGDDMLGYNDVLKDIYKQLDPSYSRVILGKDYNEYATWSSIHTRKFLVDNDLKFIKDEFEDVSLIHREKSKSNYKEKILNDPENGKKYYIYNESVVGSITYNRETIKGRLWVVYPELGSDAFIEKYMNVVRLKFEDYPNNFADVVIQQLNNSMTVLVDASMSAIKALSDANLLIHLILPKADRTDIPINKELLEKLLSYTDYKTRDLLEEGITLEYKLRDPYFVNNKSARIKMSEETKQAQWKDFANRVHSSQSNFTNIIPKSIDYKAKYKNQIYVVFSGLGKTYLCKHKPNYVDIDSGIAMESGYPAGYLISNAKWYLSQGYTVLMSASLEILKEMKSWGFPINLILPEENMKETILKRVKERQYNTDLAYTHIKTTYDSRYNDLLNFKDYDSRIFLGPDKFLENII